MINDQCTVIIRSYASFINHSVFYSDPEDYCYSWSSVAIEKHQIGVINHSRIMILAQQRSRDHDIDAEKFIETVH